MNPPGLPSAGQVLYDASCSLCIRLARRFRGVLRRRRVELRPLQTPGTAGTLGIGAEDLLREMRFVTDKGEVFGGADAIAQLARRIWWAWPLFVVSRLPGLQRAMAFGYRWVAGRRSCASGACPRPSPLAGWLPLAALPWIALAFKPELPAWGFMWAIALAIFLGCKWLTWWRAQARVGKTDLRRTLAYLLAWPGMDADAFLQCGAHFPARRSHNHRSAELQKSDVRVWHFAALKTLFGAGLIWGMARFVPEEYPLLAGWVGLVGLAFLLHFGSFDLLALMWQRSGVNAPSIMRAPILATSLGAFWGKRWNAAFHRLAHDHAFQPLRRVVGGKTATLGVFLVSGLVHEAVISLPANGGYGLPTAYFLCQGLALLGERSKPGRWLGLGHGLSGWLFTVVCVAAPAFWLFHPAFINTVILPFLRVIGAF